MSSGWGAARKFYAHTFIEILVAYQILRATNKNLCIKFYFSVSQASGSGTGQHPAEAAGTNAAKKREIKINKIIYRAEHLKLT